jgi:alpha-beta hydrolase superfamily lysophospholipase
MCKKNTLQIGGLRGVLHSPNCISNYFIVACHGLYSNKDSQKYMEMGEYYSKQGYNLLRFDFRGCGKSIGDFYQSTLTNRLNDLRDVLLYLRDHYSNPCIGLFGSSLGGVVSILTATQNQWPKIHVVVVWSTPCFFDGLEELPIEFKTDFGKYDILEAASRLPPTLFIHGTKDTLVPLSHAQNLYKRAPSPKKINFFDTDHGFSSPEERQKALLLSLSWYGTYLE